jgi:hypothetical protein
MQMKLKLIALAALLAAAGGAHAAIANSSANGNSSSGDMFMSLVSASNSASMAADLGLRLDQWQSVIAPAATGIKLVWNLNTSTFTDLSTVSTGLAGMMQTLNYGSVYSTFATAPVTSATDFKFNVVAADGLPTSFPAAGTNRYLTTSPAASITASNGVVFNMDIKVDPYINASNADTTNSTQGSNVLTAGANMYDAGDAQNVYFMNGTGDNWGNTTSFQSTGVANGPLNFFLLTNTSSTAAAAAAITKYSGVWAFDASTANLSYTVAAVPEADSYAMLLAGLGLMGAIIRRRKSV